MKCAVLLILVIFIRSSSSKSLNISDCGDRESSCVVLYCDVEAYYWTGEEAGCVGPENLNEKYEEISFVRADEFSTESSTAKFVRELASKNESIRRKIVSTRQLSHLMMHNIEFLLNGVWLEHDVDESFFPIVSIRNSTGNELEVLYLDCSLADINLQFLGLFDFTSSFVFWCCVVEGICVLVLHAFIIKKEIGCPDDIDDVLFAIFFISFAFSHISLIFYFFSTFLGVYLNFFINLIFIPISLYG
jgi:hypothetical protein